MLNTKTAIEVSEEESDFGQLNSGNDSGSDNETVTGIKAANSPLNTDLSGSDMFGGGDFIDDHYIEWDLSAFTYNAGTDLSSSTVEVDTITPKATSSTDITDLLYWGVGIPGLTPADFYYGSSTFSAVLDELDWE